LQRLKAILDYVDLIRVDHFRGLEAFWAVKEGETTAMNGEWVEAPGTELFETVLTRTGQPAHSGGRPGGDYPRSRSPAGQVRIPGMKILHFAFGSDNYNPYLPFNYIPNCLVYTGTHDNDTTVGWYDKF
jgi:4-alpha-glucanotransferase